jgi:hypothetical protein
VAMVRRHKRAVPEDMGRRIGEARALYDRGIHDGAEARIRVLLPECDATLGERHPESIALRNLLGSVLFHEEALRKGSSSSRSHGSPTTQI